MRSSSDATPSAKIFCPDSRSTPAASTSVGRLITGTETWNGGGHYVWEINDVDAGEITGWDLININGSLTINATSANKFTLDLTSLTLAGAAGPVNDFAQNQNYVWRIAKIINK